MYDDERKPWWIIARSMRSATICAVIFGVGFLYFLEEALRVPFWFSWVVVIGWLVFAVLSLLSIRYHRPRGGPRRSR